MIIYACEDFGNKHDSEIHQGINKALCSARYASEKKGKASMKDWPSKNWLSRLITMLDITKQYIIHWLYYNYTYTRPYTYTPLVCIRVLYTWLWYCKHDLATLNTPTHVHTHIYNCLTEATYHYPLTIFFPVLVCLILTMSNLYKTKGFPKEVV